MEYRVLGPLEVVGDDGPLALGGAKQRALLALLVLNANRVVSRERLVDGLWGDDPPETAVTGIQVYVSRWRKVLPPDALVTRAPGYLLAARPEEIDLLRFESLVAEARGAAPQRSASLLREALALWRGPALGGLALESSARTEPDRLEELRLAALEERIAADLALGRHAELVGELQTLIGEHPHRERLRGQLMLALYRSGRQAEALEAYRAAREALVDELGLDPSDELRQLEQQILAHDATLAPPSPLLSKKVPLPGPLRAASRFPFVGRTKELDALRSLLELAEQDEGGQVALIGGEAGSGKTRLARELAHEAAARGALVLYGAAFADVTMPYRPFVEALEFLLRVAEPSTLEAIDEPEREELGLIVPGLGSGSPPQGDPESVRRRMHRAVASLLARVSSARPTLLVIDDIHWADAPSIELLRDLGRGAPEGRLLVVATYRTQTEDARPALGRALAELARLEGIRRVQAAPLSSTDIGELIARSSHAAAAPELSEAIRSLTDGTPFLVCELWRALLDTGAVDLSGSTVTLIRPVAELNSPESVRDVVSYRVSRLSSETRAVLELASVAGPSFELATLGDGQAVVDAAAEGVATGMIESVAEAGTTHRFTHELVRRGLYDRLSSVRRAELHFRVAETLERRWHENVDRHASELAHHFTLAVPVAGADRAIEYSIRAARGAAAALAFDEAARLLSTALELAGDERTTAALATELGLALRYMGESARAVEVVEAGIEAAKTLGDQHLVALAMVELTQLRTDSADESAERDVRGAIAVLEDVGDDLGLAKAWHVLGSLEWSRCRFSAAEPHYIRALRYAERCGDRRQRTTNLLALGASALHGPMPVAQAIERCETVLADGATDRLAEPSAAVTLGVLYAMAGRFDDARRLAEHSIAASTEFGLKGRIVAMRESAALIELVADCPEAAEQHLRINRAALLELAAPGDLAFCNALLAEALCRQGRFEEAEPLAAHARESTGSTDIFGQVTWRRAAAKTAAARADTESAQRLLREAAPIADATDSLNLQADVYSDISETAVRAGDARSALRRALQLYRRKGNLAQAARAEAAFSERLERIEHLDR